MLGLKDLEYSLSLPSYVWDTYLGYAIVVVISIVVLPVILDNNLGAGICSVIVFF